MGHRGAFEWARPRRKLEEIGFPKLAMSHPIPLTSPKVSINITSDRRIRRALLPAAGCFR